MHKKYSEEDYLMPQEVLEHYPGVKENFNWGTIQLGTFLSCHILQGTYSRKIGSSLIKKSSLIRLIDYANSVLESQKIKMDASIIENESDFHYLTPTEAIEKYPKLRTNFRWRPSTLGTFVSCKILIGYYHRGKRVTFINSASLEKLINYVNHSFDLEKITNLEGR